MILRNSIDIVEGEYGNVKKYIILDDFIGSGRTTERIAQEIYKVRPEAVCLGVMETRYLVDSKRELESGTYKLSSVGQNQY